MKAHRWLFVAVLIWLTVALADWAGVAQSFHRLSAYSLDPGMMVVDRGSRVARSLFAYIALWQDGWHHWAETEQDNVRLRAQIGQLQTAINENEEFRTLLHVPQPSFQRIVELSGSGQDWWLRAGCRQGLVAGSPVLDAHGSLVGVVKSVDERIASLDTLLSPEWRLPVRVGTASAIGLVRTDGGVTEVTEVSLAAPITVGDVVVTAGDAMIPSGLPVGEVLKRELKEGFAVQELLLRPYALPVQQRFVRIEERDEVTCP